MPSTNSGTRPYYSRTRRRTWPSHGPSAGAAAVYIYKKKRIHTYTKYLKAVEVLMRPHQHKWCSVSIARSRTAQFPIQGQLLRRKVKRFQGGLMFKAHRLVYHSNLGWRVMNDNKLKRSRTLRRLQGPRKALRGGISGAFLEPLVSFCQLSAEKCPGFLKYV